MGGVRQKTGEHMGPTNTQQAMCLHKRHSVLWWPSLAPPAEDCDITPPLRSRFQMLHQMSKESMRKAEWRWTRGRDGGPGLCSGRGPES